MVSSKPGVAPKFVSGGFSGDADDAQDVLDKGHGDVPADDQQAHADAGDGVADQGQDPVPLDQGQAEGGDGGGRRCSRAEISPFRARMAAALENSVRLQ